MTQEAYIFLIILTIAGAFFLAKKLTKSNLISRIAGILISGGWIIYSFIFLTASSALFKPQIALILITFLACYVIIKIRQKKENLEEDNANLRDSYKDALNEKDEYRNRYEETLKEKEDLEHGTKDLKKRGMFKPIIDIFKMLKK
tara:strand:+ start:93 stop:527 length:435 start_codon:yes stop_codon:yes gene_type:complete